MVAAAKGAGRGATNGDTSRPMADTLKHLSMHWSGAHLCAALQHGQSCPDAAVLISAIALCDIAMPADAGSTARLMVSSAAMTKRITRMAYNYARTAYGSTHGFVHFSDSPEYQVLD